jgi:PPK2 family polyphosphate:nucleotide phosphotransferase
MRVFVRDHGEEQHRRNKYEVLKLVQDLSVFEGALSGLKLALRSIPRQYFANLIDSEETDNGWLMKLRPVSPSAPLPLLDRQARVEDAPDDEKLKKKTEELVDQIADRQRMFYADGRFALLIVLQGRDASGKDGTIRKVFTGVNPQGMQVASFKVPTEEETHHDFLWRVHQRVPPRRMFGIFNRSHYEDAIVPRVYNRVPKSVWEPRYDQINAFEKTLSVNGVRILKFFLHVSREEQKERLKKRLSDPEKNWKFNPGDLAEREQWDAYTAAYRDAIRRCSTRWAPWYVVPADDKKVRNYLIARTVADTLSSLKLRWPKAEAAVLAKGIR